MKTNQTISGEIMTVICDAIREGHGSKIMNNDRLPKETIMAKIGLTRDVSGGGYISSGEYSMGTK